MLWKGPKYSATGSLLEALNPKPFLNKFQDHLRHFGEARARRSSGFRVEGSEVYDLGFKVWALGLFLPILGCASYF